VVDSIRAKENLLFIYNQFNIKVQRLAVRRTTSIDTMLEKVRQTIYLVCKI